MCLKIKKGKESFRMCNLILFLAHLCALHSQSRFLATAFCYCFLVGSQLASSELNQSEPLLGSVSVNCMQCIVSLSCRPSLRKEDPSRVSQEKLTGFKWGVDRIEGNVFTFFPLTIYSLRQSRFLILWIPRQLKQKPRNERL